MRLYNQTGQKLRWEDGAFKYVWDPYGFKEVDERLVEHMKAQKLPVDVSPVSPERRAKAEVDAATEAALNDQARKLSQELEAVNGDLSAARLELERVKVDASKLETQLQIADREKSDAIDRATAAQSDLDALRAETLALAKGGVAESDAEAAKAKAATESMVSELGKARAEITRLSGELSSAEATKSAAEGALKDANGRAEAAEAEAKELKKQLKAASKELAELKDKTKGDDAKSRQAQT